MAKVATASRFTALCPDSASSEDSDSGFQVVKGKPKKAKAKPAAKGVGSSSTGPEKPPIPGLPLSGASKKKKRKKGGASNGAKPTNENSERSEPLNDEEIVAQRYEADLEEAILRSKLSLEDEVKQKKALQASGSGANVGKGEKWQEPRSPIKQHVHVERMSKKQLSESEDRVWELDLEDIRAKAEAEARKIALAELKEADYERLKPLESAIVTLYKTKLEEASEKLKGLATENAQIKAERNTVKARVKNLCKILQSAEMKDNAELASDLEKATKLRDECYAENEELAKELEQAKTKIHNLENQLKKFHDQQHEVHQAHQNPAHAHAHQKASK